MKKTIYCKPEIEVTKLNLEHLLNISGNVNGNTEIGFDGPGEDGDVPAIFFKKLSDGGRDVP